MLITMESIWTTISSLLPGDDVLLHPVTRSRAAIRMMRIVNVVLLILPVMV